MNTSRFFSFAVVLFQAYTQFLSDMDGYIEYIKYGLDDIVSSYGKYPVLFGPRS